MNQVVVLHTKNGPRIERGPDCLGSLVFGEVFWRPNGGGAVGAEKSLGGGLRFYGRSAPVEEAALLGGAAPWAAKLFSINRICTLLVLTGLESSSPVEAI